MFTEPPAAIAQIAQRAQRQEQGVVIYRMHRIFDVAAGPKHRHEDLELAVVSRDTLTVKIRVLHSTVDGNPSDSAALQKIEDQYEHPKAADVFHRPFDPQYLPEYTYQALNATTYQFTGVVRDSAHGDGTFTVDSDGNVVSYQYVPCALPQYSKSATIAYERSQVLPGTWEVTSERRHYTGRFAFVNGSATATMTYDSYARYPDVSSAEAALVKFAY